MLRRFIGDLLQERNPADTDDCCTSFAIEGSSIILYCYNVFEYPPRMTRVENVSRRLKLRQLEVLLAVTTCGSMAKAAQQLAVSQPVVSKTIADLENTLGVRLLDRSPQGVEPTLYGRALLDRSVAIFNDLRASVSELEFLADPTAGELRIGSSEAAAAGILGAILDRLSRRHPRLTFEVTLGGGLTDLQHRELQTRNLDLIIGRIPTELPEDTHALVLYPETFLIVAGTQNPWTRRRKINLSDLVNEPWCLPSLEAFPWTHTAEAFRAAGLDLPHQIVTARSILVRTGLVATGRFITTLPSTVLHFRKDLQLKILPVDVRIRPYPFGIITLKNRTLSPSARLFVDCAREVARPFAKDK